MEDFFYKPHPVIINGYSSNYTLSDLLSEEWKKGPFSKLNSTQKLIIIYRIAYAMKCLHSKGIYLGNLNINNIYIEDGFYPIINPKLSQSNLFDLKVQYDDIYDFAQIIYEVMTAEKEIVFKNKTIDTIKNFAKDIIKNLVDDPLDMQYIPFSYQILIDKCRCPIKSGRPTFSEIEEQLRTDSGFITFDVDETKFLNDIRSIEKDTDMTGIQQPIYIGFNDRKEQVEIKSDEIEKYFYNDYINDLFAKDLCNCDYATIHVKYPSECFYPLLDKLSSPFIFNHYSFTIIVVDVSQNVKSLEDKFLTDCTCVKYVNLPNSLKTIGPSAFKNCLSLFSITIPSSVVSIGENCFENCQNLSEVIFEEKSQIKEIKSGMFKNCKLLKKIILPPSVTKIEFDSFYNCISLDKIESNSSQIANQLLQFGLVFFDGKKVEKDEDEAIRLFRLSAKNGNSNAMFYYAYMLEEKGKFEKARYYYNKSAEKGNIHSMYKYASFAEIGIGGEKDVKKAFHFYKKAAENGEKKATYKYAYFLENGIETPMNKKEALNLYAKSADKGDINSMYRYAYMLENGIETEVDLEKALHFYKISADKGNSDSMFHYAYMLENGIGTNVDFKESLKYYKLSADKGNVEAMYHIGYMYENGIGNEKDPKQAIEYYEKASDKKHLESTYRYAFMLENGIGTDFDINKAFYVYQIAAESEHVNSMYRYAMMLENGFGVKANKKEAYEFFKKAALKGDKKSKMCCSRLKRQFKKDKEEKSLFYFKLIFTLIVLMINFLILLHNI